MLTVAVTWYCNPSHRQHSVSISNSQVCYLQQE